MTRWMIVLATVCVLWTATARGQETKPSASPYARWKNGPSTDPNFFAVGVWGQSVKNAKRYREAGVNLYVGADPKREALKALREQAIGAIVGAFWRPEVMELSDDPAIVGWILKDEPDISQPVARFWKNDANLMRSAWPGVPEVERIIKDGKENGPLLPPRFITEEYARVTASDPTRPVLLNCSFGVATSNYNARQWRNRHDEDYPEYFKGADIGSQDFYPMISQGKNYEGKLWYVAKAVLNLRKYVGPDKVVWNIVEGMKPRAKLTPHTMRAGVWMSLVHGAQGIVYFVHQMGKDKDTKFIEASVFEDPEMAKAFTETNLRIAAFAPVLNSPTLKDGADVASSEPASKELADLGLAPIAAMAKRLDGATYVFAVRMEDIASKGSFTVKGLTGRAVAEVLGEDRKIDVTDGKFSDDFKGYEVHLYKIK